VYTECKELSLPEVDGDRSVEDFVYAIEPVTPGWSGYWKNELQRLEWEKKRLPSFFELVEIYRNHRRMELARKGRTSQGSYAVTFKGESTESSKEDSKMKPKAPCVCGGPHPYYDCWYLNEVNRPSWWKPTKSVQKTVDQKIADASPELKAKIDRARRQAPQDKKPENVDKRPNGNFTVYQVKATTSDYDLRDSVILSSGTTLHIINDRARFVDDIRPSTELIDAGSRLESIKGFGTAKVMINTPEGKKTITLLNAAYIPSFHTSLVCLQKLNEHGVFWDNKNNLLYYGDRQTYAYCGWHSNQSTLEYHELKQGASDEASFAKKLLVD
jgi:hypothetical protein